MSCCGATGNGQLRWAGYGINQLGYGGFSPVCRPFVYGNGCPIFPGPGNFVYGNGINGNSTISPAFAVVNGLNGYGI